MPRRKNPTNLLPANAIRSITAPGRYSDGGGLYLQVRENSRSWLFMYRWGPTARREMGLGRAGNSVDEVSLSAARDAAARARVLLDAGIDPIEERNRARTAAKAPPPTFGKFADEIVAERTKGFKNAKHRWQWEQTLGDAYCASLRRKRIDLVSTEDVLAVLRPIWADKQETASRVRGRIELVLDAAKARGHREGENPARWRGHLDKLLSERRKLQRGHMAAMPVAEVPGFIAQLRERDAVAARALEFLILTASRSGEVREATWAEIDLKAAIWTIPAERMKVGEEHRVPLTARMVAILKEVKPLAGKGNYVFPGGKEGRPLSNMVFAALFERMGVTGVTAHGFRSAFRDWAGDHTAFPRELAEAALAHRVGNAVEQAYRRSDALEKRRKMMAAWERYLSKTSANVVSITAARA